MHQCFVSGQQLEVETHLRRPVIAMRCSTFTTHMTVDCSLVADTNPKLEGNMRDYATIEQFLQTGPFGSQLHKRDYPEDGIGVVNPYSPFSIHGFLLSLKVAA